MMESKRESITYQHNEHNEKLKNRNTQSPHHEVYEDNNNLSDKNNHNALALSSGFKTFKEAIQNSSFTDDIDEKLKNRIDKLIETLESRIINAHDDATQLQNAINTFKSDCIVALKRSPANVTWRALLAGILVATLMFAFVAFIGFTIGLLAGAWLGPGAFFVALAGGSAAAISVVASSGTLSFVSGLTAGALMFRQRYPKTLQTIENLKPADVKIEQKGDEEYREIPHMRS